MEQIANLDIDVLAARNLSIKSSKVEINPYVIISIYDNFYRTNVVKNTTRPKWNVKFSIDIHNPFLKISIEVKSRNTNTNIENKDQFIGKIDINLGSLFERAITKNSTEIKIPLTWFAISANPKAISSNTKTDTNYKTEYNFQKDPQILMRIYYKFPQEWSQAYFGYICITQGYFEDAIQSLTEGILKTNSKDFLQVILYSLREICYELEKKYELATHDILLAIERLPTWGYGYFRTAILCLLNGEIKEGMEQFRRAQENEKDDPVFKLLLKRLENKIKNTKSIKAKDMKEFLFQNEEDSFVDYFIFSCQKSIIKSSSIFHTLTSQNQNLFTSSFPDDLPVLGSFIQDSTIISSPKTSFEIEEKIMNNSIPKNSTEKNQIENQIENQIKIHKKNKIKNEIQIQVQNEQVSNENNEKFNEFHPSFLTHRKSWLNFFSVPIEKDETNEKNIENRNVENKNVENKNIENKKLNSSQNLFSPKPSEIRKRRLKSQKKVKIQFGVIDDDDDD
ncbi:extended synaptotagmin-like protein 2 isoform c [Anaeramoeba ignava]|uniref:Extended synaptotagmin-like protein 2 isoform c n=1 Tax=Anaeramoeba ignava TaxID=1746090 RepID=A0A9Q0LQ61_ANAIG|nr:extended synaptotagmin-like protein 2 isoform c [Anaeramoeba ignava]